MTKIAILIIIALIIAAGVYTELQRGNNLAQAAKRLGLDFTAGLQPIPPELESPGFDLLVQGNSEIGNRMSGTRQGYGLDIFDYSYDASSAGDGFASHPAADDQMGMERRNQTVIHLRSTLLFPDFDVSPSRGHQRQVAARFGFSPLVLEEDRPFNQDYRLLTRDSQRCRALFTAEVRTFLLNHPGLVVEGRGQDLLFYRFSQRLKAKQLQSFLQEVEELAGLLESALATAQ